MKINIFKIPYDNVLDLKTKFKKVDLSLQNIETIDDWSCSFYLSKNPEIKDISWVNEYHMFINEKVENKIYYAVFLCKKNKHVFTLTYGKSHFYVRQFCDDDFGLEIAKRIAKENDIKQIATKRFNSSKKKEIRSYVKTSILNNESGESVEHLNATIINDKKTYFGDKAKFGSSVLLSKKDLEVIEIPEMLDEIINTLKEDPKFNIPKTEEIKNDKEIITYFNLLIGDLLNEDDKVGLTTQSYDIVGTDIVFSGNEKYKYKYYAKESEVFDDLDLKDIVSFIKKYTIPNNKITSHLRVEIEDEGRRPFSKPLRDFLSYNIENKNIIYQNGKWIKFNNEYIKQIDDSISNIKLDKTESEFLQIEKTEPEFNYISETPEGKKKGYSVNNELIELGYESADKDFETIQISGNYKVEAWDLKKGNIVYAVKFGNAQKLVYVCNQAINVLEILRNNSAIKQLDKKPEKYVLWLGITNKKLVKNITDLNSIILKQQIDLFARKCRDIGIEPMIKISQKIKKVLT